MFYKVLPTTDLYQELDSIFTKKIESRRAILDLNKEIGATGARFRNSAIAGDVWCFHFDEHPGPLWKVKEPGYMPKLNRKANQDLLTKIDSIPRVSHHELNAIVGYDWNMRSGRRLMMSPDLFRKEKGGPMFLGFSESCMEKYKPHQDMIEITRSEFIAD